jgi:apolipoprotein N-acyltransferase
MFVPAVLVLVTVLFVWGHWQSRRPVSGKAETAVGYLQPDIGQEVKWDPAHARQTLQTTVDLSRAFRKYHLKLMVWPESSTPFEWDADEAYRKKVAEVAAETESPILLGSVLSKSGGYENGAVLVMPDGRESARYSKTHLVPFGEYIPFREWLSFAGPIVNTIGDFQPGMHLEPLDSPAGKIAVTICFEGIFPDLVREQVRLGAQVLVNMTNDAWYEGTPGPYQHFLLERVRAVETDRYLIRSANRGICGVVNPRGVLVATTTGGPASFWGLIAARDTRTPWTRAGNVWLLLPLACLLALAIPKGKAQPDRP